MSHIVVKGLQAACCLLLLATSAVDSLGAQMPRDSLVARAAREFDAARRIQLLVAALDPSLGGPDEAWSDGVQRLAQTFLDQRRDSASAALWLRWAIRLSPGIQADTDRFLPSVATALRAARAFVDDTKSSGDSLTTTSWVWPKGPISRDVGQVRISATGPSTLVLGSVDGGRPFSPGSTIDLPVGSHEVRAFATGFDTVRVTREVLPGVTTVLTFHLPPRVVLVPPIEPPSGAATPPTGPLITPRQSKHFPWLWVALGAAGAGTAAWFLTRPKTGSISITVPNPQ
jgi:hypothetical protein